MGESFTSLGAAAYGVFTGIQKRKSFDSLHLGVYQPIVGNTSFEVYP